MSASIVTLPSNIVHLGAPQSPDVDAQVKAQASLTERSARIAERFEVLELLTTACAKNQARSLIVSGPPGLGKTFAVEKKLVEHDPTAAVWSFTKGYILATGLYKTLYEYRHKGSTIVLDDADRVFTDPISLGILKAVLDTTQKRVVSWKTEAKLYSEDGTELLPKQFEFEGSVIFVSNIDFDHEIAKNNNLSPHLAAIISRSHYIDLALKDRIDYLIRIVHVIRKEGMLGDMPKQEQEELIQYIHKNYRNLRELSLRMVKKLVDLKVAHPTQWQRVAAVTCCLGKI